MSAEMTAEEIRIAMEGEDDEGKPGVMTPSYDIGRDLIACLAILRSWGDLYLSAEHDVINVTVGDDSLAAANRMGRDVLRALATFGWGYDDEIDSFYRFI